MTDTKQNLLGKKILIVSSDINFLNAIERIIIFAGAEVIVRDSSQSAVSVIKSQNPDFMLLDTPLSDKSLNDFFRDLEADITLEPIPIIVLTEDNDDIINLESYKIEQILTKSKIDHIQLINEIEKTLSVANKSDNKRVFDISEPNPLPTKITNNNIRILIIEDDSLLRDLLSIRLTKSAIPFQLCRNGDEALLFVHQYKPTLILLDIMLPGKNGLDVLAEIRQEDKFKNLPVIVFSNKDNDEDRARAKALGAKDFLVKAMTDLNDLITKIYARH